jgi:hypothetical protein
MVTGVGSFKSYQLSEGRTTPVPNRVSPTDRIRAEIDALFDGSRELGEVIEDVARLGARLIIQTAVEAEVEVFLGRARYQRSAAAYDARPGMRNGYCPATVKTTAGPVEVARPKLRGTTERFAPALFGKSVTRSNALEALVIAGFVRGLSVRDVENTLADALGAEAALSKSTVSRVCQAVALLLGVACGRPPTAFPVGGGEARSGLLDPVGRPAGPVREEPLSCPRAPLGVFRGGPARPGGHHHDGRLHPAGPANVPRSHVRQAHPGRWAAIRAVPGHRRAVVESALQVPAAWPRADQHEIPAGLNRCP